MNVLSIPTDASCCVCGTLVHMTSLYANDLPAPLFYRRFSGFFYAIFGRLLAKRTTFVQVILAVRAPLKILNPIIILHSVYMVNFLFNGEIPEKRTRNESVNQNKCLSSGRVVQANTSVSEVISLFQDFASPVVPNSAHRAHAVRRMLLYFFPQFHVVSPP